MARTVYEICTQNSPKKNYFILCIAPHQRKTFPEEYIFILFPTFALQLHRHVICISVSVFSQHGVYVSVRSNFAAFKWGTARLFRLRQRLNATYAMPLANILFQKSTTIRSRVTPRILWMLTAHANMRGICSPVIYTCFFPLKLTDTISTG